MSDPLGEDDALFGWRVLFWFAVGSTRSGISEDSRGALFADSSFGDVCKEATERRLGIFDGTLDSRDASTE